MPTWSVVRVVECACLENRCCESNRRFESATLRQKISLTKGVFLLCLLQNAGLCDTFKKKDLSGRIYYELLYRTVFSARQFKRSGGV